MYERTGCVPRERNHRKDGLMLFATFLSPNVLEYLTVTAFFAICARHRVPSATSADLRTASGALLRSAARHG
jgi:hypothetical protein